MFFFGTLGCKLTNKLKGVPREVVILFDGCDRRYISYGFPSRLFPNISSIVSKGFDTIADAAMPTCTNPNSMSVVAGAPPKVHGISGNYYPDRARLHHHPDLRPHRL